MNKILLLICLIGICSAPSTAGIQQQKPVAPKPVAPAPKATPPYVLKRDYEPQMQEMNSKVNSALNTAGSLRRGFTEKFEQVTQLNTQMQKVEQILNSANFQIALTSDSLKETRFSMEEFRKGTEKNLNDLRTQNSELTQYLWICFGSALLLTLILIVVVIIMMNSKIKKIKTSLKQHTDNLSKESQKHLKELKEEVQNVKSQLQGEMYSMKAVITGQVNRDLEETASQIKIIMDKLQENENAKAKEGENNVDNDEIS